MIWVSVPIRWVLPLATIMVHANYTALPTDKYIPDYGIGYVGDPTGEAKWVVGHRYFLNDADWQVSTLAGVFDVTLKQISERLYVVTKTARYGYNDGATEASRFWNPNGIAYYEGSKTLYVSDKNSHRIRKIYPETGVTKTFAGTGVAGFQDSNGTAAPAMFKFPSGLAVDAQENVYVADMHNHRIRVITPDGTVQTVAGAVAGFADLKGTRAMFNFPTAVAAAKDGTLFVADMNNHKIRKIFVTPGSSPLSRNRMVVTFAGSTAGWKDAFGPYAKFHSPTGVALHHKTGDLYVADCSNQRIRKVDMYGAVITIAGSSIGDSDGHNALMSRFNYPFGIAVSQTPVFGHPTVSPPVYFTDSFSNRVRVLRRHYYDPRNPPSKGEVRPDYNCTTVAGGVPGYLDGWGNRSTFFLPAGIVVTDSGVVYVADSNNNVIRKLQTAAHLAPKPMCKMHSGKCEIRRQCRDLSGALCAYRPDPCLADDRCLCDVLFHNATCNEIPSTSSAPRSLGSASGMVAVVCMLVIRALAIDGP